MRSQINFLWFYSSNNNRLSYFIGNCGYSNLLLSAALDLILQDSSKVLWSNGCRSPFVLSRYESNRGYLSSRLVTSRWWNLAISRTVQLKHCIIWASIVSQCVVWLCCNKKSHSASGDYWIAERERWEIKREKKTEIDGLENTEWLYSITWEAHLLKPQGKDSHD